MMVLVDGESMAAGYVILTMLLSLCFHTSVQLFFIHIF